MSNELDAQLISMAIEPMDDTPRGMEIVRKFNHIIHPLAFAAIAGTRGDLNAFRVVCETLFLAGYAAGAKAANDR